MKKDRYNIFNKSHKGLRRLVFETGSRIQKADFSNINDVKNCVAILLQATRYYVYHIKKEDSVVYKAIDPISPYIVSMMETANAKGVELALSIEERIHQFNSDDCQTCIIDFGIELESLVFSFTSVVLQHIKKEENVLNQLLWENYSDSQLLEMEINISNSFLPEEKIWFNSQVVKWLNDNEIANWVDCILSCGNTIVADLLMKTTRSVLPEYRWHTISQNIEMQRA